MGWWFTSIGEFCGTAVIVGLYTCLTRLLDVIRGQKGQSSLRELLQPLVEDVLNDKNLSINTNPLEVYKAWINQMESETGQARYESTAMQDWHNYVVSRKNKVKFSIIT